MFTIPWVGKAGWKAQDGRLEKSLLLPPVTFASVFKAACRLTPWILCALGLHKGNTFLWRTPLSRTSVSDFSQSSSETLAWEACIQSASGPMGTSGGLDLDFYVCLCSTKWKFPASGNGLKLTNQGTVKHEHIRSPGEKEASNLCRNALFPASQWEARLWEGGFL